MLTTRLHRLVFSLYLAAALAVIFVLPALAQAEPPAPVDLLTVLRYLITGGCAIVAAVVVSWLAEQWPAFGAQPPVAKMAEQGALSVGLGVGAWYLVTYQMALVTQLTPIFTVIVAALAPLIANQVYHAIAKKA